jgi:hypothetical protein
VHGTAEPQSLIRIPRRATTPGLVARRVPARRAREATARSTSGPTRCATGRSAPTSPVRSRRLPARSRRWPARGIHLRTRQTGRRSTSRPFPRSRRAVARLSPTEGQAVWRGDGGNSTPPRRAADGGDRGQERGWAPCHRHAARAVQVDLKEHRHANFDTIDGQRFLVNRNVDSAAPRAPSRSCCMRSGGRSSARRPRTRRPRPVAEAHADAERQVPSLQSMSSKASHTPGSADAIPGMCPPSPTSEHQGRRRRSRHRTDCRMRRCRGIQLPLRPGATYPGRPRSPSLTVGASAR